MKLKGFHRTALLLLLAGFVCHLTGLGTRMFIMSRPPVTNIYESIIFVGFISVLCGLFLEKRLKNRMGILIAASIGTVLHFMGMRYDADGDTMGMLVAVLDTNFWLATHVVTITIGYAFCIFAGTLAHVHIIHKLIYKNSKSEQRIKLFQNIRGLLLIAIFFATLGTILGGIWADQSWGRFWGWDPKENGALLIVLWLIFILHGKISGRLKESGFIAYTALSNVIVVLAWFGVNLLSVGLHAYGFTESAAFSFVTFCSTEVLFVLGSYLYIRFYIDKKKVS
jgi:ABC-type transport system involved in cytochrome c biogenesis permease subunit